MSRTDILSEIKEAETRADAKVAQAEADKKSAIADARRDFVKKIQSAEANCLNSYESAMNSEKEKLKAERVEKLAAGKEEASSVEKRSEKNIKEVNDFLKNKFEEIINVTF